MARASTITGLSLDQWGDILGISPWDLNQFSYPAAKGAQCTDVLFQYPYQRDHLSREEIARAIADAEAMLAEELHYWPYPRYIVNEEVQYPRPHQRQLYGFSGTPRGEWKTVPLQWHRYMSGGVFNRTLLGDTVSITLTDPDGDTVKELFTAVLTVPAGTNPAEIGLYFTPTDRLGEPLSEIWRIRPVNVTVSGTTATITGHSTLLVKPVLTQGVNVEKLDAKVETNYVATLEGWRVFTDTSATAELPYQGVAAWKNIPDCTQDCTFEIKELCLGEHSNSQGRVFASFGTPSSWPFPDREPDRLYVNYVAGMPLVNGKMEAEMARIVTYLSVSLLANEKCGCERTNRIIAQWRERITRFVDISNKAAAYSESTNTFPMTVGGQYAWKRVIRLRDVEAVSI